MDSGKRAKEAPGLPHRQSLRALSALGEKPKAIQGSMIWPDNPAGEHSGIVQNKKWEMQY